VYEHFKITWFYSGSYKGYEVNAVFLVDGRTDQ